MTNPSPTATTTLQPEMILRDTVVLVPVAALVGGLGGGLPLAAATLVVGLVVLANLWLWTRLSKAWLASAASEDGDFMVAVAMGLKSLLTVPLFIGLTYLCGPVAIGLGLGVPLLGGSLRLVYIALTASVTLPAEETSS